MIDLFSTQSFDRHDISTLTFWQLHRKYLWQFVTVIIYSTKKLMDIRIALRMIWTTKVWHIQDALCKPESFRSIHRLGNKSPAPTTLDISFIFFHLLSTAKQVESRTADAALKPRHLLETIPPASAVYMMSHCLWPLLHSARIGFYTDWIKSERISWMDGMTHNCDTQVHRWKQNSDISDMQHDNTWQKVKKIRIEDLLSGFQHIQSLRVRNEWISCRSHVEKTEKQQTQQTQQALVWRLEVNQFFDHLVKNGTVSQELLTGTYQKRSTRIPASRQSNSKTWWMRAQNYSLLSNTSLIALQCFPSWSFFIILYSILCISIYIYSYSFIFYLFLLYTMCLWISSAVAVAAKVSVPRWETGRHIRPSLWPLRIRTCIIVHPQNSDADVLRSESEEESWLKNYRNYIQAQVWPKSDETAWAWHVSVCQKGTIERNLSGHDTTFKELSQTENLTHSTPSNLLSFLLKREHSYRYQIGTNTTLVGRICIYTLW